MAKPDDDWFTAAADEVVRSLSPAAKRRLEEAESQKRAMAGTRRTASEAAEAAAVFGAVASGSAPALGSGPNPVLSIPSYMPPRTARRGPPNSEELRRVRESRSAIITPEKGLEAILEAVRTAGDSDAVLKAGGEWITKITNQISQVIRDADDE